MAVTCYSSLQEGLVAPIGSRAADTAIFAKALAVAAYLIKPHHSKSCMDPLCVTVLLTAWLSLNNTLFLNIIRYSDIASEGQAMQYLITNQGFGLVRGFFSA